MTVSRVLNNQQWVKESTRERVQATIRELDYVANEMARQIGTGRHPWIGILALNLATTPYSVGLTMAIEQVAREHGWRTYIVNTFSNDTENTLHHGGLVPEQQTFLSLITGSFATPAAENPTVAMIEAAYEHHRVDARYLNCDVAPDALGDAVRGARAMGWVGFNCSIPHKVSVIKYLDGLGSSAALIGAVNCVVRRDNRYIGENTDGQGFLTALRTIADPAGKAFVLFGAGGARARSLWKRRSPGRPRSRL